MQSNQIGREAEAGIKHAVFVILFLESVCVQVDLPDTLLNLLARADFLSFYEISNYYPWPDQTCRLMNRSNTYV